MSERCATTEYRPPPHWPSLWLNAAEWYYFERAGLDMRQFALLKPIPIVKDR